MSGQHWPSAKDADAQVSDLLDLAKGASSTIFVRNLSFDVDDKQLGNYFDCGPVKKAFTLKDKNTDASRGVGFVEFAFAQDAKAAIERYNGKNWMGRELIIELALQQSSDPVQRQKQKTAHMNEQKKTKEKYDKEQRAEYKEKKREQQRLKEEEIAESYNKPIVDTKSQQKNTKTDDKKGDNNNTKSQQSQPQQQQVQSVGCILLLSQLDNKVEESEILNKCKKYGNVVQILFPSPESTPATKLRPESLAARVTFDTYKNAKAAMAGFEGRSFGANRVKPKMKLLSPEASGKVSRLIVRNLPFSANEGQLKELFGAHGHLTEVHLPVSHTGQLRGFGFVQFQQYEDAVKAIAALNGHKIGSRAIAVDFTLPKAKFDFQNKINAEHQQMKAEEEATLKMMQSDSDSDDSDSDDSDDDQDKKTKKSKRNPNEMVKLEDGIKMEPEDTDDETADHHFENEFGTKDMADSDDDEDEDDESELVYKSTGDSDDDEDEDDENDDESDSDDDLNDDEDDVDENGIKIKKSKNAKGKMKSDVNQGRTIFIRNLSYDTNEDGLYNKFSTYGRIMMVKICRDHVLNRSLGTAFIKFVEPKVVQDLVQNHAGEKLDKKEANRRKLAYTSLLNDSSVRLDGRDLIISLAVEKNEAVKLREEGQAKKKDKRNLYLAKEGVILPETSAAEGVSKTDMEKRQRGWTEKKKKLRNPNFSVSTTRLSFRNIPYDTTDKELRTLVLEKTKEQLKKDGKKIGAVALKQVRIERDGKKMDKNGIPKSKGFGFVEFRDHDHALTCLRLLNNNPNIWSHKGRPIIEFALEDARKLLIHRKRFEKQSTKVNKADSAKQSAEEVALSMLSNKSAPKFAPKRSGDKENKEMVELFKSGGKSAQKDNKKGGAQKRGRPSNNDNRQGRKDDNKKQRR